MFTKRNRVLDKTMSAFLGYRSSLTDSRWSSNKIRGNKNRYVKNMQIWTPFKYENREAKRVDVRKFESLNKWRHTGREEERESKRVRLALLGLSLLFSSFPVLILHLVMQKWPTASPYFTSLRASSFCSLLAAINLFRPTCIRLLLTVAIKAVKSPASHRGGCPDTITWK